MTVSAILMGVSVALAMFQSKPDASSRVVVTFPYEKSSVTSVQGIPGARVSGTATPIGSWTSIEGPGATVGSSTGVSVDAQSTTTIPDAWPMYEPQPRATTSVPATNQPIPAAVLEGPVPTGPAPSQTAVMPKPSTSNSTATQNATSTATPTPTRTVTPTRTPTASPSTTHWGCTTPTRPPTGRPAPTATSWAPIVPVWPAYRPSVWSPRPSR